MKLLEQFITQTGKQPPDWTSEDMQKYMAYVKARVTAATESKNGSNVVWINDCRKRRYK
jgi:hypothetical protein